MISLSPGQVYRELGEAAWAWVLRQVQDAEPALPAPPRTATAADVIR